MTENSQRIRSEVINKYMEMFNFFSGIYKDILDDQADDTYNALHRTVPILSKLIDDVAGDGKEIDKVIAEMEKSTRSDFSEPDDGAAIPDSELENEDSAYLMKVKVVMREMLVNLKENFGEFIQACCNGLIKNASVDLNDVGVFIIRHYVDEACRSCGVTNHKIEDVTNSCNDMVVVVKDEDGRRFMIIIGDDMTFRGIYPINCGSVGSYSHYHDMFRPSLYAIGHIRPPEKDFIVLCRYPSNPPDDDGDVYDAYDMSTKKPIVARIVVLGGKKTKKSSYSIIPEDLIIKSASSISDIRTTVKNNAEKIATHPMVKINISGSKYDGMAGTVDTEKMIFRNDHVEFPVILEYDTGLKTELWVTDDDVVAYG